MSSAVVATVVGSLICVVALLNLGLLLRRRRAGAESPLSMRRALVVAVLCGFAFVVGVVMIGVALISG